MKEAADLLTRLESLPQALRARLLKSRATLPHSWRARDTIPRGLGQRSNVRRSGFFHGRG
jgi:hypothetical protein